MYLPRKGVTAHYIIIHCPVTHPGLKKAIHGERHVRVLWGLNTYVSPVDVFVTVLYTKTVVMCCF